MQYSAAMVIRGSLKGSLKGRRANTAKAGFRGDSVGAAHLDSITEWDRYPTPQLEPGVDLFYCSALATDDSRVFEACLPKDSTINRAHRFFHLPTGIRHKIYGYCFPLESRKISLSPAFATKTVFGEDHFATPWDVTADVLGALESFRALRHEMMTYFWSSYQFHVTLTPFSGRRFSPLDQIWLRQNLHIIQNLSVEIDYTKFGGSTMKLAPAFGHCKELHERILNDVILGLLARKGTTTMSELHIMCRRYAGCRPPADSNVDNCDLEVSYCPENTTFICGAICEMRGMLKTCRLSGFSQSYAEMMLSALYSQRNIDLEWSAAEEHPWPQIISNLSSALTSPSASTRTPTSAKASANSLDSITIYKEASTPPKSCDSETQEISASTIPATNDLASNGDLKPSRLILQLTRSQSFRQDVEEQMNKSELCLEFKLDDCNDDSPLECVDDVTIARHHDNYQTTSAPSLISRPQTSDSLGHFVSVTTAIPRSTESRNHETSFASTLTPISQVECLISHSPYTMNRINEQDPAFQRTISAIRKRDDLVVLQNPSEEQPEYGVRPVICYETETKQANAYRTTGSASTKRRYIAFVNKLHNWTN